MFLKKIDKEKLTFKVFFSSIIILLLSVIIISLKNQSDVKNILEKKEQSLMIVSENQVKGIYNYYYESLRASMNQIVEDEQIVKAFAERNREELKRLTLPNFNILVRLGIGQYQFHLPNNTSFFRVHSPSYYGDDLSSFRKMVVEANAKQKTISGIEEGVAGPGIRYIRPVFWEGEHVGTIELGISLGKNFSKLLEDSTSLKWYFFTLDDTETPINITDNILSKLKNNESFYLKEKNHTFLVIPIADYSNDVKWYATSCYDRREESELIGYQKKTNYLFASLIIIIGTISMVFVLKYTLKELSYLVEKAKVLEKGDFTQPIKPKGATEIKELANALELMRKSILKNSKKLEASKQKFKILSDSASDWIVWRSPDGEIIYTSPSCKQITGYTAEQFINSPKLYNEIIHPDQRQAWLDHVHLADSEGNPTPIEFQIVTKDGKIKWISHVCSPTYDLDGNFTGIRGSNVDITDYKVLMNKLENNNEKLRDLSSKILQVQELERKHLSRELHDELGQILTAIKLNLQMLNEDTAEIDNDLKNRLIESIKLVDFATKQVRRQALDLRPPALDDLGLIEAIRSKCKSFSNDTKIETNLIIKGNEKNVDEELGLVIYRCVQEALTNVARHAKANNVTIIFDWREYGLLLTIEDDGCGFNIDEKDNFNGHMGLIGMEERIDLIDGQMKVISNINKGTKIEFLIPINGRER